nr:flagellar protein FlaG [uncultured Tolumonas sp.]
MANEITNMSSASISTVVFSDMSGRQAAQTLSSNTDVAATPNQQKVGKTSASADLSDNKNEQQQNKVDAEKQRKELEKQAQNLQSLSELKGWSVSFRVDDEANKTVITVVDSDTNKPIRQIPDEELLALSKRIKALTDEKSDDELTGLFLDSKI